GVSGFLLTPEIAGKKPDCDGDTSYHEAEGELQEGEVAAGAGARDGDDGDCGGLGRDDRQEDRPGGQVARTEEIVARGLLMPGHPQTDTERDRTVRNDDREVERAQGRR